MVKLITTDTYFGVFEIMCERLKGRVNDLDNKNLVFCDEKATLMAERMICDRCQGSLNTSVYSFGNFLHVQKPVTNMLSKEASAMVIKKIVSKKGLSYLKASKSQLAPTLLEVIYQIKSARITPLDLEESLKDTTGVLRGKLTDIASVYQAYEDYLTENNYLDQYSAFTALPSIIDNSSEISKQDVFLVGFSSFTSQIRQVVKSLLKKAKSVTAILVGGENKFVYVNEVVNSFKNIVNQLKMECECVYLPSSVLPEGKVICNGLFNPIYKKEPFNTQKVYSISATDISHEIMQIACAIKEGVKKGLRYKDISIATSNINDYKQEIFKTFALMDIPFFLDEQKKPDNHPLVCLILAYIDIFKRGAGKAEINGLCKNPLMGKQKSFTDQFEKYVVKNNLCYGKFFKPFTVLPEQEDEQVNLASFEEYRQRVCSLINGDFNVKRFLTNVNVQNSLEQYTKILEGLGETEQSAINSQIYDAIMDILNQMDLLLEDANLDYLEYKGIFLSGVSALKLSILPQYNDAVFIGDYKEISLAKAKYLFAIGLNSDVPNSKEDVSILSDSDIDRLKNLKVLIEPKIQLVNLRTKESIAMALSAFSERLFVSCPISKGEGGKNTKSEVLEFVENSFTVQRVQVQRGYYTHKQGLMEFAKDCSQFTDGFINDFSLTNAFYEIEDKQKTARILQKTNQEIKSYLTENKQVLINNVISPTAIEDYYKCPYMSFLSHALKISQEDDGNVSNLSVGNLMHELFEKYLQKVNEVVDKDTSDKVFNSLADGLLKEEKYNRYLSQPAQKAMVDRVLSECKKFCYKNFLWLKNSLFKSASSHLEVEFNDKRKDKTKGYDSISLLDGKVKLKGKIDRVDIFDEYCRIIDYKTGSADVSEEKLFAGVKLQLYLYALAVSDKKLAGAYYMPISDSFKGKDKKENTLLIGKTLNDSSVINAQDKDILENKKSDYIPVEAKGEDYVGSTDEKVLNAFLKYAFLIANKAVKNMQDGVIIPSPFTSSQKSTCDYCQYKGMCDSAQAVCRKVGVVKEQTIFDSVNQGGIDE